MLCTPLEGVSDEMVESLKSGFRVGLADCLEMR